MNDFDQIYQLRTLLANHIQVICRAIVWPKDMENVLELAFSRILIRREKAEKVLRKKRIAFDIKLDKHQKQLEMFRKKDPPLLQMEDMEESVEIIEEIVAYLQVSCHRISNTCWVCSFCFSRTTKKKQNKLMKKNSCWISKFHHLPIYN